MRKKVLLIGLLIFIMLAGVCSASVPRQQTYTFGRLVDASKISEKTKDELQRIVNSLGDPPKSRITFNGFRTYYGIDDCLNIDVFVRNGYDYAVRNLEATVKIKEGSEIIAATVVSLPTEYFGEIKANSSKVWTITFKQEQILKKGAKLATYTIESYCSFKH